MRKPNLFLLGAPKCGTTTLVRALEQHSKIFLPYPKETDFWATDVEKKKDVTDLKSLGEYLNLFSGASPEKTFLLDGSVTHLFSEKAIPAILDFNPEARFIIMLRNPVEQVQSLHQEQMFAMNEDVSDFWTAWNLQEARARGERVPPGCPDPVRLAYARQAMLGDQLERAMALIPKDRLFVGFIDDLKDDPQSFYGRVLDFLELEREKIADLGAAKSSRTHRYPAIARLYQSPPKGLAPIVRSAKYILRNGAWTQRLVRRLLIRDMPRNKLSDEKLLELHELLDPQVVKMERLTHRDLSSWKKSKPQMNENTQNYEQQVIRK